MPGHLLHGLLGPLWLSIAIYHWFACTIFTLWRMYVHIRTFILISTYNIREDLKYLVFNFKKINFLEKSNFYMKN